MREIKFRAVYKGALLDRVFKPFDLYDELTKPCNPYVGEYAREGLVFEQYTGLKDKNGKEIYEGDIVLFNEWVSDNPEIMQFALVVWDQEKGCFILQSIEGNLKGGRFIHYWDFIGNIAVIGNIHENPGLLS